MATRLWETRAPPRGAALRLARLPVCPPIGEIRFAQRTGRALARKEFWLDRIVASMPRHEDVRTDSYLEVLESALLDRYLSAHEEDALVEVAASLGLDRAALCEILRSMSVVALEDGIVTRAEPTDLEVVARLLGLTVDDVAAALDWAKAQESRPVPTSLRLAVGDLVCLTGQMSHP